MNTLERACSEATKGAGELRRLMSAVEARGFHAPLTVEDRRENRRLAKRVVELKRMANAIDALVRLIEGKP